MINIATALTILITLTLTVWDTEKGESKQTITKTRIEYVVGTPKEKQTKISSSIDKCYKLGREAAYGLSEAWTAKGYEYITTNVKCRWENMPHLNKSTQET